jgi:hypothetical protein
MEEARVLAGLTTPRHADLDFAWFCTLDLDAAPLVERSGFVNRADLVQRLRDCIHGGALFR